MAKYFSREEVYETLRDYVQYDPNQRRTGALKYTYQNKGVYFGQWKGGFRDGWGIMKWKDGSNYKGQWVLGWAHGQGEFHDKLGNVYEGPFYMSMAHGDNGTYVNTFGDVYKG